MDLHCHLDLYPDALKLLPEVSKRNKFTLSVTTSPRAWLATSRVFSKYPNIHVALGLHPEIVQKKANERDLLISLVKEAKFIGEVGLDGSPPHRSSLELQKSILTDVFAECEKQGGRIISLHSRGAASAVLDIIEMHPAAGKPILHWFSGTSRELKRAVSLGCWFSVGPAMLTGAKGQELVAAMPQDKILPETDGPFARSEDGPLMPWQAQTIAPTLEQIWGVSPSNVDSTLLHNLQELLLRFK